MSSIFGKLFSGGNDRELKKLWPIAEEVNDLEPEIQALDDDALRAKTDEFRRRIQGSEDAPAEETLDDILPEAFAVIREGIRRRVGQRAYDVQLMGAMVLHQGKIAELKTGEGKTLVAALAMYLNALEGRGVHLIT